MIALVLGALFAADPTAALIVERDSDAHVQAECPEAPALTALVMRRLGRDPFDPLAARKAFVHFSRDRAFQAEVIVREPDGREGTRTLSDRACEPLAEAVALALAVAIDPLGLDRPHFVRPRWAVRAAEDLEVVRRRRAPPDVPEPVVVPPAVIVSWSFDAGLLATGRIGIAPNVMLGLGLDGGYASDRWRLELRADVLFASPGEAGPSRVAASTAGLAIAGCYRTAIDVCVRFGGLAWTVAATEGLADPIEDTRLLGYVALAATVAAGGHAYVGVELLVPFSRPVLTIEDDVVWRAWPVVPAFSAGARL